MHQWTFQMPWYAMQTGQIEIIWLWCEIATRHAHEAVEAASLTTGEGLDSNAPMLAVNISKVPVAIVGFVTQGAYSPMPTANCSVYIGSCMRTTSV